MQFHFMINDIFPNDPPDPARYKVICNKILLSSKIDLKYILPPLKSLLNTHQFIEYRMVFFRVLAV